MHFDLQAWDLEELQTQEVLPEHVTRKECLKDLLNKFPTVPGSSERTSILATASKTKKCPIPMEMVSRIWDTSKSTATSKSTIMSLPPELLQHIASFLPRPTAAVFAFTCKNMQAALGSSYWNSFKEDLRDRKTWLHHWFPSSAGKIFGEGNMSDVQPLSLLKKPAMTGSESAIRCLVEGCMCRKAWKTHVKLLKERRQLLELLNRDTLDLIRCGRCMILHKTKRRGHATDRSERRECEAEAKYFGVEKFVYPGFTFPCIQQAMKMYRNKQMDQTVSYLRSLSQVNTTYSENLTHVVQATARFHIKSQSFLARMQYWILFPTTITTIFPLTSLLGPHQICGHLILGNTETKSHSSSQRKYNQLTSKKILDDVLCCRVSHHLSRIPDIQCDFCMGLHKCRYCSTEFTLDLGAIAGGTGIVITKWADFGAGEMCADRQWLQHFTAPTNSRDERWERICGEKGTVRDAFERGRRFEWDRSVSARREEELRGWLEKLIVLQKRKSMDILREVERWRKLEEEMEEMRKAEEAWADFGIFG